MVVIGTRGERSERFKGEKVERICCVGWGGGELR